MGKTWAKGLLVLLFLILIGSFFQFGLYQYLTLDYLKQSQEGFRQLYEQSPLTTLATFSGIYILSTALSLPGAALLTLLGGALFGAWVGTVAVSFASTIGATLAFLAARFLMRDWVQARFASHLEKINRGIESEGNFYLFSLRLIPVVPFFVINLVMGLTSMRAINFFVVSQIGMLPGTFVYVNAGKELAQIDSLAGILSPSLWVSFGLLGLLPLVSKKLLTAIKKPQTGGANGKV